MRVNSSLVGLLATAVVSMVGCHRGVLDGHDPYGACEGRLAYNLPPAERILEPGPGVGGPGPGVIPPAGGMGMGGMGMGGMGMGGMGTGGMGMSGAGTCGMMADGSVMPASYSCGCGDGSAGAAGAGGAGGAGMYGRSTSQIAFLGAEGTEVSWDVSSVGLFDSVPLVVPGRQDFLQGAIYRLRLSNIPGRPGVELFPTLEVAPVTPRTDAYLAHSPIPVQFTEEDFDQVLSGNFVTKVIYLPDPEFQELALSGVETLVSTRLDPGVDPIAEADRRGSILAILRIGNKDLRTGTGAANYSSTGVARRGDVMRAQYENYNANGMAPQPFDPYDGAQYNGAENAPSDDGAMYPSDGNYYGGPTDGYPEGYSEGGEYYPSESDSYSGGGGYCAPGGGYSDGGYSDGGYATGGYASGSYAGGADSQMPLGMPTSAFAPTPVPPQLIAGGPTWGMPYTGTPIGLPGPPHVPLGHPAGLQKHVMKNRTRVVMPPPVTKMSMSVKQRPGMNYPRPVNHVRVDEVHREPGTLLPGWLTGIFHGGAGGGAGGYGGYDPNCQ